MSQVYNFNAGPAVLPADVMQQAQAEFVHYGALGFGIMEASHRAPEFEAIIQAAEANLRALMGIPEEYAVLFLQGGASLQFGMVPMNLLPAGGSADYADTGTWSSKAIKEAKLFGNVNVVCSSKATNYDHIPAFGTWKLDPQAAYLHVTSNNTIFGTQYASFPTPPAGVPMIADMSSDILSRPLNVRDFAMIYAGAQKNLGPSGVTLVIMRKELAARCPANVTTMLKYSTHIDENSLYNTPPTFGIYILKLVTEWVQRQGGVAGIAARNEAKAKLLYDAIDGSGGFYRGPAKLDSRSRMNLCFTLPKAELDKPFLQGAVAAGLVGLKGHRSVGGMRASLYNAMPLAGVEALVSYMRQFRSCHG